MDLFTAYAGSLENLLARIDNRSYHWNRSPSTAENPTTESSLQSMSYPFGCPFQGLGVNRG